MNAKHVVIQLIIIEIFACYHSSIFVDGFFSSPNPSQWLPSLHTSKTDYQSLVNAIDQIFPPQGLDQRIALSRKDGYWPFVSTGDDPPKEFVYGEFDIAFFNKAVERAIEIYGIRDDLTFCDLGSGTGRLVLTAAAMHPFKLVRGVELLPSIHEEAIQTLDSCKNTKVEKEQTNSISPNSVTQQEDRDTAKDMYLKQYRQFSPSDDWLNQLSQSFDDNADGREYEETIIGEDKMRIEDNNQSHSEYSIGSNKEIPLAPIELTCGSFDDPYEFFGDANIVFCFSSAMPYHVIINLARSIGRQCQQGTLVLTTEYALPEGGVIDAFEDDPNVPYGEYKFELLEELHGFCDATGGESTVFIQRLAQSLGTGRRISKPKLDVSDLCYSVVKEVESNDKEKLDSKSFLRNVYNQMAFLGLPESWWQPHLKEL